jgi:hypothetical protein
MWLGENKNAVVVTRCVTKATNIEAGPKGPKRLH